jgi:ParB/RepB/Spo0J family partition protein
MQITLIPLDQIQPSPTNPRKTFDESKLRELAESIKLQGVLQPILVRPLRKTTTGALVGGDLNETLKAWPGLAANLCYELVAGERRWRASKIAGVETIPALVRDLDDKATLEIQVIENLQRSDLSPLEEAEGYRALLDRHGYTADGLADKIGKSKSYVYARLKLNNLPEQAREALIRGDLPATVGELIGRLPSLEMREKLWETWFDDDDPPSFRDAKDIIESQFMRELKGAPFSQTDKKLLPEVGSCKDCPKRTGNNRNEYPDGRADICTDVACFKLKVEAANKRLLDNAAGEGVRVLSEKEVKEFFPYGDRLGWQKGKEFIDLDDECFEALTEEEEEEEDDDKPAPKFGEILGDAVKPTVVGLDSRGNLHRLVPRAEAAQALREKGIEIDKPQRSAGGSVDLEYQKRRDEEDLKRKARSQAMEEVATKVAEWFGDRYFNRQIQEGDALLKALVAPLLMQVGFPTAAAALKRRGRDADYNELRAVASEMDLIAADVVGLIAELCARYELSQWSHGWKDDPEASICEFAGIDYKEFEKRALKSLKDEAKPKKKSKAKAAATA